MKYVIWVDFMWPRESWHIKEYATDGKDKMDEK